MWLLKVLFRQTGAYRIRIELFDTDNDWINLRISQSTLVQWFTLWFQMTPLLPTSTFHHTTLQPRTPYTRSTSQHQARSTEMFPTAQRVRKLPNTPRDFSSTNSISTPCTTWTTTTTRPLIATRATTTWTSSVPIVSSSRTSIFLRCVVIWRMSVGRTSESLSVCCVWSNTRDATTCSAISSWSTTTICSVRIRCGRTLSNIN